MDQPIKNAPGFVRDERSGAVINTNTADYALIIEKRKHKREMDMMAGKVDSFQQQLKQLEELVKAAIK
jgi:hypothetical protein